MTLFKFSNLIRLLVALCLTLDSTLAFAQGKPSDTAAPIRFPTTGGGIIGGSQSGGPQYGQGQQRDYGSPKFSGEISSSCPFQAPSASVQALADRVKGALESLKNHAERECSSITPLITEAQQNIDALVLTQQNASLPVSGVPDMCVNYQARLRRELDLVVAQKNKLIVSYDEPNPDYARCDTNPNFNECANEVYLTLLNERVERCGARIDGAQNQQLRDNLENINRSLQNIISGSNSCPSSAVAQSIMQTAIAQATSTASLSAGFGLVGLGVGLAGRLLSSLATRFFNRNSPEQFLNSIGSEEDRHTRFCLFYDVQKANLKCEQRVHSQGLQVTPPSNSDICVERAGAFDRIGSDILQIRRHIDSAARATASSSASGDRSIAAVSAALRYDDSFSTFMDNMTLPVGNTGKNRMDILREMADSLGRQGANTTNASSAVAIREALKINDNIARLRASGTMNSATITEMQNQTVEFVKLLTGLPTTSLPNNSFNYATALQNHKSLPPLSSSAAGTTVAGTLTKANEVAEIALDSNNYMTSAQNILQNGADENMLELLLSASVTQLRPEFTRRLREQNERYIRYRGTTSDPTTNMRWLGEMLAICMTTQGASYFPNHRSNSMLEMSNRPNEDYQRICSQFNCPNQSVFVPFDANASNLGNGTLLEKFTNYQCASDRRFPAALENMRNNLQRSGTICGAN